MCNLVKQAVGRVYVSSSRCIYENLAFEEYIFRSHDLEKDGDAMLIWSNKPAVVIGRHQNPWIECNLPFLRKSGIDLARRHSGGGTVYHDMGNLNISLLTSHKSHCRPRNLRFLSSAINDNFRVNVVPNSRDDMELQPGSRKCSGTAARISRGRAYHHLTLLVEADLRKLSTSLKSPFIKDIKSNATASIRAPAVGFLKEDDKTVETLRVREKIVERFAAQFETCPIQDVNVLSEMSENEQIAKNYYDLVCFDWVFGKTPKFTYEKDGTAIQVEKGFITETSSPKYTVGQSQIRRLHPSQKASQDYYVTLGVRKDATQREIKSAYYQLSKKYHPDVAGKDATAAAKFIEISEAYDCLRDPQKRRAYDNQVTGGGGRYTGDYSQDPFGAYQQAFRQSYQRQQGANPFHDRQFTQAEYERIWNHFNRMRNERETYDQRMEYERQKLWMEFARRRAERWQAFHQRYPNGPPGSFKWEFSWGNNSNPEQQERRVYQGRELLRRIVIIYFVCFLVVSFVQVFYYAIGANPKREVKSPEAVDNIKIQEIMNRMPASQTDYIYRQPQETEENQGPIPSERYSYYPGQEVTSRDEHGSSFSTYITRP